MGVVSSAKQMNEVEEEAEMISLPDLFFLMLCGTRSLKFLLSNKEGSEKLNGRMCLRRGSECEWKGRHANKTISKRTHLSLVLTPLSYCPMSFQ